MRPRSSYDRYHRGQVTRALRKARTRGLRAELTYDQWKATLKAADDACIYCGAAEDRPHIDHFVPLCWGGHTVVGNCMPTCKPCNDYKNSVNPLQQSEHWWRSFGRGRDVILAFIGGRGGPVEPALLIYHHRNGPCADGPFVLKLKRVTCPLCRSTLERQLAPGRVAHAARCRDLDACLAQAREIEPDARSARFLAKAMLENEWTKEDVLRFRARWPV